MVFIKNTLIGILFVLIAMQSVLTYLLAITLESKKQTIAMLLDEATEVISETHHSHLSYIEHQIDETVTFLKQASQEDSQKDKSRSVIAHFFLALYCETLPSFNFVSFRIPKEKFPVQNEHFHSSLWVYKQPHPPQV